MQYKVIGYGGIDHGSQTANNPAGNACKKQKIGKRPFNECTINSS
jgi:hypothetical protein